jgi:hypothetical protein
VTFSRSIGRKIKSTHYVKGSGSDVFTAQALAWYPKHKGLGHCLTYQYQRTDGLMANANIYSLTFIKTDRDLWITPCCYIYSFPILLVRTKVNYAIPNCYFRARPGKHLKENSKSCWVSGLCPSSGILNTRKRQRIGKWICSVLR